MNKKRIFCIVAIGFFIFLMACMLLRQQETEIFNKKVTMKPNVHYYVEFTVESPGTLNIEISGEEGTQLLWYLFKCSAEEYLKIKPGAEFYEKTYKRNISGGNVVKDQVLIEAGTYTFVCIQAADTKGETDVNVRLTFKK